MTIQFMPILDAAAVVEAYHAGRDAPEIRTAVTTLVSAIRQLFPPGIKEGEAQIERGETVPFAEAKEQAKSGPNVTACPVCGSYVLHSCYHDGDDKRSVLMTVADAMRLRIATLRELQDDVDAAMSDIEEYCLMVINHHLPPEKVEQIKAAWEALNCGPR